MNSRQVSCCAIVLATALFTTDLFALDARGQDLWPFVAAGDLEKVRSYLATPGVDINDRYVVGGVYDDPNLLMDDKSLLDLAVVAIGFDDADILVDRAVGGPNFDGSEVHVVKYHDGLCRCQWQKTAQSQNNFK